MGFEHLIYYIDHTDQEHSVGLTYFFLFQWVDDDDDS